MNLVFAGTPPFAVPALEALLRAGHSIQAVYTQPDRPAGRGRKLTASAVKQCAQTHGLVVRQPPNLKDETPALRELAPEAIIVIAYGLLLPPAVLVIPRYGCINVHASLLPRWRGAAPIPRAIEAGDAETGVTIMQMEAGLDTGPMLARAPVPILASDTAQFLHDRLAPLGAQTLLAVLNRLARDDVRALPQDEAAACYAKKLRKDEAPLDWSQPAQHLHRKVRALNPWPVACTTFQGRVLRVWEVGPPNFSLPSAGVPGTVVSADAASIGVATGDGVLHVTRLQETGGRVLSAGEFLNGARLAPGDCLGGAVTQPVVG